MEHYYLIGGLEHDFYVSIGNVIIPTDEQEYILQRGRLKPLTSYFSAQRTTHGPLPARKLGRISSGDSQICGAWLATDQWTCYGKHMGFNACEQVFLYGKLPKKNRDMEKSY